MKTYKAICPICKCHIKAYTSDICKCPQYGHRFTGAATRQTILDEAAKCVTVDRNTQYGEPEDSFRMIAELWGPYIRQKCGADVHICAEDVAAMMALFKIARIATGQKKADNWIDGCGYLACGGELSSR